MNQKVTDWQGQEIKVGTRVIYHRNHNGIATWGLGKVTKLRKGSYGEGLLDIEWERHNRDSKVGCGVSVEHVTVWAIQSGQPLKSQLAGISEYTALFKDFDG